MADISGPHEIRVRGRDHTIVFLADSKDGRLVIRQEPDENKPKQVCAITLSDLDELRAFFKGLRCILSSLGQESDLDEPAVTRRDKPRAIPAGREQDRDAVVAQARQRNPQAFAPWRKDEEQEIRRRYEAGESIPTIARDHKRSRRTIELRLQRLGLLPPEHGLNHHCLPARSSRKGLRGYIRTAERLPGFWLKDHR